jgi:drug/metabolite transporter (DMT)-like permease
MSRPAAILLIGLSVAFQILAGIFAKVAAVSIPSISLRQVASSPWYLACLGCLGLQTVTWTLALRRLPLFSAYLCTSLIYVSIPLTGWFVFREPSTFANLGGSALILLGIVLLLRAPGKIHG